MDLETLVRPFETKSPLATKRITPVRAEVPTETAGGRWGKAGNLPVPVEVPPGEDPLTIGFEVKKSKEHDLVSRETEKVRVQNPDDPNQYVVIERLKSASFKDKKPDTLAAYNAGSGSVSQATPGASPNSQWQPGEVQVKSDGSSVGIPGQQPVTYPLKIEDTKYNFNWPPGPNEVPFGPGV